jgi:hypothetical protein
MSIEIKDLDGGIGVLIACRDQVTEAEYLEVLEKHLAQDPDRYRRYRYCLADHTGATGLDFSAEGVRRIVTACGALMEINPDKVIASVADNNIFFGYSRMWEMLNHDSPWETAVFRQRREAEAWLRERVAERFGIDDLTFAGAGSD